jgi:predicted metal-dependent hydrolase
MRELKKNWRRSGGRRVLRAKRELLKIDGKSVEVILRADPRARRFIVKVDPATGQVVVVSPTSRSLERALDFARGEKDWIAGRLANVPPPVKLAAGSEILFRGVQHQIRAGNGGRSPVWIDRDAPRPTLRVEGKAEHTARRLVDWLKREARRRIDERVADCALMLGVKPKRITIRDTSSRWGSCSSTRTLSFSWRLVLAPPSVLDYVVAHEVAHLRELNHSPRFWRLVELLVADSEKSQRWLSENGTLLHRYAPRSRPLI